MAHRIRLILKYDCAKGRPPRVIYYVIGNTRLGEGNMAADNSSPVYKIWAMAAIPPPTARRTLTGTEAKFWPSFLGRPVVVGVGVAMVVVMMVGTPTVTEVVMGITVVAVSVAVAIPDEVSVVVVVLVVPEVVCWRADATATKARAMAENFMGVYCWLNVEENEMRVLKSSREELGKAMEANMERRKLVMRVK